MKRVGQLQSKVANSTETAAVICPRSQCRHGNKSLSCGGGVPSKLHNNTIGTHISNKCHPQGRPVPILNHLFHMKWWSWFYSNFYCNFYDVFELGFHDSFEIWRGSKVYKEFSWFCAFFPTVYKTLWMFESIDQLNYVKNFISFFKTFPFFQVIAINNNETFVFHWTFSPLDFGSCQGNFTIWILKQITL